MELVIHSKFVYDAAGKIIEVILPFHEFQELRRRATKNGGDLHARVNAPIEFYDDLSAAEMTQIALHGGAFDWLKDEPELYSDADGEPV